jgi:hypothetical protein
VNIVSLVSLSRPLLILFSLEDEMMDIEQIRELMKNPHIEYMILPGGQNRILFCTKPIEDCATCEFRIDAMVEEECLRKWNGHDRNQA